MSVIRHRRYGSSDVADIERAAGRLEIISKTHSNPEWAIAAHGASKALYALAAHDIDTDDDMVTIWTMLMTSGKAAESED